MNKYDKIVATHPLYAQLHKRWHFLLQSYIGGAVYRMGGHLTRYAFETDMEYEARLLETPIDNHCKGVIQTYISFLFRKGAERDYGSLVTDPGLESFLEDADLEGRSLDAFMKDAATFASVFGHVWLLLSKPQIDAVTRADELASGVRPYANMISPINVLHWNFKRMPSGVYELDFLRYQEDSDGTKHRVIKEWTPEMIVTYTVNDDKREIQSETVELNGLGKIPAVLLYNQRSPMRGIGFSDIEDIADQQLALYNENSEIIQLVRLSNHPALVKTAGTEASAGAGAIVQMEDNLDPGLKPYLLQPSGGNLEALFSSQRHKVEGIDRMASIGSVRTNQTRTLSGVAMETEFQMLNAKLSEKADSLELAEEQMWRLWAEYQGKTWDGEIDYPDDFSIQDKGKKWNYLQIAKQAATDPRVLAVIDHEIIECLGEDADIIMPEMVNGVPYDALEPFEPVLLYYPETSEEAYVTTQEERLRMMTEGWVEKED